MAEQKKRKVALVQGAGAAAWRPSKMARVAAPAEIKHPRRIVCTPPSAPALPLNLKGMNPAQLTSVILTAVANCQMDLVRAAVQAFVAATMGAANQAQQLDTLRARALQVALEVAQEPIDIAALLDLDAWRNVPMVRRPSDAMVARLIQNDDEAALQRLIRAFPARAARRTARMQR